MPAKNIYHDAVIQALVADGWTITHDPLTVSYGGRGLFVDLAAERSMAVGAEKDGRKIAVEIQSFLGLSPVRNLQQAIGQYLMYEVILKKRQPERVLYLAVPKVVSTDILEERFGRLIVNSLNLRIILFSAKQKRVIRWIN